MSSNKNAVNPNVTDRRLNLLPRILLGYLLVPALILSGLFYFVYKVEQEREVFVEQQFSLLGSQATTQVNDWIDKNIRLSRYIKELDGITSMDPVTQKPFLQRAKKETEWMTVIFTADLSGNAVSRNDDKPLKNYADRVYFQNAIGPARFGQQILIGKNYPVPLHCFALPIENKQNTVGALTQCSKLTDVSNSVANLKIGETGYAFLIDNRKQLIASGRDSDDLESKLQDFSSNPAVMAAEVGRIFRHTENDVDKIGFATSTNLGWTLILQQDYDEAFAEVIEATRNTYILLTIAILLTIVFSLMLSRSISKPINALTNAAVNISRGNLKQDIPGYQRSDEVGDMARAVLRLRRSIEIAISRLTADRP